MTLAALLIVVLGWNTERIDANNGTGWDGGLYVSIARNPVGWLVTDATNYTVQRALPSFIVHYSMKAAGLDPGAGTRRARKQVLGGFRVLNGVLLVLSAYVWCRTAALLQISDRGKWLGFVLLFMNFFTLKMRNYYAPLTDYSAYAIGLFMLYFYLKRSTLGLFLTTLAGVFTWPSCLHVGGLLLLFPRPAEGAAPLEPARWQRGVGVLATAAFALVLYLDLRWAIANIPTTTETVVPALNLSVALAVLFIFFGTLPFADVGGLFRALRATLGELRRSAGLQLVLVGVLVGIRVLQVWLTLPRGLTPGFEHLIVLSIVYPAVFFVAHAMWFGPGVILATFLWRRVADLIREHGLGVTLVTILTVVLSLDSESRILSGAVPIVFPFVVKAVDSLAWDTARHWFVAVLSLLVSKVWLTIGRIGDSTPFEMPGQLYFMNIGPWMTPTMYVVQGCATLCTAWLLYDICLRRRSDAAAAPAAPAQAGSPTVSAT